MYVGAQHYCSTTIWNYIHVIIISFHRTMQYLLRAFDHVLLLFQNVGLIIVMSADISLSSAINELYLYYISFVNTALIIICEYSFTIATWNRISEKYFLKLNKRDFRHPKFRVESLQQKGNVVALSSKLQNQLSSSTK